MLIENWEELGHHKEAIPLDPDFDRMQALEEAGAFKVWAARDGKTLVGLITFYICPHMNYRSTLYAIDGDHYLVPSYRSRGLVGLRMWRGALGALKELGVRVVVSHDNTLRPMPAFFQRLGLAPRGGLYEGLL